MTRLTVVMCALAAAVACQARPAATDSAASAGVPPGEAAVPDETQFDTLNAAWWVSWRIPPRDTVIEGLPVGELDSTWTAATALADVTPPPGIADSNDPFRMLGARFTSDGDFNRDGRADRALVGTYRTTSGAQGRFVAILTRADGGGWEKAWVYTLPGAPAFSALIDGPRGVEPTWIECMECDTSTDIRWRGTTYQAIVHSCCDDEPRPDTSSVPPPPEDRSAEADGYTPSASLAVGAAAVTC